MIELQAYPGQHVKDFAGDLVRAAAEHGAAKGTHNNVEIVADGASTVDVLLAQWQQKMDDAATAYRNSPEGKAAAERREAEILKAQETHDRLVRDLATLDFKNDVAVLDWLCAIQDSTDHTSVVVDKATILAAFDAAGLKPSVNTGSNFKADDRDNVFRYIVGQALDCLKSVAIHGIVHKFVADWKAKFLRSRQH